MHLSNALNIIESVIEKPTPTIAGQKLIVPGLRSSHCLCFFGMHVLSPAVLSILEQNLRNADGNKIGLSEALNELALSGNDRDQVMAELLEFFAIKNMNSIGR